MNQMLQNWGVYYAGDDAWDGFVAAFQSEWDDRPDTEAYLISIGIDRPDLAMAKEPYRKMFVREDFAIVLAGLKGPNALIWGVAPVPNLGNESFVDILRNGLDRRTIEALRMFIMAMSSGIS
jgi:hypothetical protein